MHVDLAPAHPAGRGSRLRTVLSVLAPAVGLLAVVAIAWPGPAPDGARAGLPGVDASTAPPPAASPPPTASGPATVAAAVPPLTSVFGLPVRSIDGLRQARVDGEVRGGLVAVAGYLSADRALPACSGRGDPASIARCTRFAILSALPTYRGDAWPPHIHLQVLPGTDLPVDLPPFGDDLRPERVPSQVILIGRYDDPRAIPCAPGGRRCGREFVLERIAWADGELLPRTVVRDPSLEPGDLVEDGLVEHVIALREADRAEIILGQAVVGRRLLRAIDADAADAVPAGTEGPVWYQRAMAPPGVGAGERLVTWVVIDDATGFVLAVGPREAP